MIEYKTGDIFQQDTQAIVNTVNCVGVMGRGLALQFKKRFPDNFNAYAAACKNQQLAPGKMFVFEDQVKAASRYIINFPTKRHWRDNSRMEDIEAGLQDLEQVIRDKNITSLALPPLGCGLGGLDWSQVRHRIEEQLAGLPDVQVIVLEPQDAQTAPAPATSLPPPAMTPGRAALIVLMQRYLGGLLDPFVTLLEVHKLMYFMQEAGEPLRLAFKKGHYGPYAENLRHVLNAIEGHFVTGYADGGDQPDKQLTVLPQGYAQAAAFLEQHDTTHQHFDQVVGLVEGFESPFGLELLATVHWVMTREVASSADDIVARVHAWNPHKQAFSPRQITLAAQVLADKGWLNQAQVMS